MKLRLTLFYLIQCYGLVLIFTNLGVKLGLALAAAIVLMSFFVDMKIFLLESLFQKQTRIVTKRLCCSVSDVMKR